MTGPCPIKGRGHSTVPGTANVDDGVLMNLRNADNIALYQNERNAIVGPGNSLVDFYGALDRHNFSVVIGRYDAAGFDLMVTAGISVFNFESYEVVIADGSLLHTSLAFHPDLHSALTGGNNSFGP